MDDEDIRFKEVTLGRSYDTSDEEKKREFLDSLASSEDFAAIEFSLPRSPENRDTQLTTEILEAVQRNPNVSAVAFDNMRGDFPWPWICVMLGVVNRIQTFMVFGSCTFTTEDASLFSQSLKRSTSLKKLKIEYACPATYVALSVALDLGGLLQLETLNFDGLSQFGFRTIAGSLHNCKSLKTLILTPGNNVMNLDDGVDDFCKGLEAGSAALSFFTLSFDLASPQSVNKVLEALSTKHTLQWLSFASNNEAISIPDAGPMERFLAANTNLKLIGLRNLHFASMAGMFSAMQNHKNLKTLDLFNTLSSPNDARALANCLLAENRVPLESIELCNFGHANKHDPLVPSMLEGLCSNKTLKKLHFYMNEIHEDDLVALATVLEENSSLQQLRVSQQYERVIAGGDDKGLVRFGEALGQNEGITSLCFKWEQNVGKASVRALVNGVKANSTLKWVDVEWLPHSARAQVKFYIGLNDGLKQALHAPLNVMAFAFEQADKCRKPSKDGLLDRVLLPDSAKDQYTNDERLIHMMLGVMSLMVEDKKEKQQLAPPSELFFFVRERCDLFNQAGDVARRRIAMNESESVEDDNDEDL